MSKTEPLLLVLSGPVGGGKSTTAQGVVQRLRAEGWSAAHIDLDVLYLMARQTAGFDSPQTWACARKGASALAGAWFRAGIRVAVVEGNVFTASELKDLSEGLDSRDRLMLVGLLVSWESTAERVRLDPSPDRVASRNTELLKKLHDEYLAAMPFLSANATLVATDGRSIQSVVESVMQRVADLGAVSAP